MKLYEVKLIVPAGIEADDVDSVCRKASEQAGEPVKVIGTTVHARPPDRPVNRGHVGTVLVATTDDVEELVSFGGAITRLSGMVYDNEVEVGTGTLSLKEDEEAIADLEAEIEAMLE